MYIMKNLLILAIFIVPVVFISCEKENNGSKIILSSDFRIYSTDLKLDSIDKSNVIHNSKLLIKYSDVILYDTVNHFIKLNAPANSFIDNILLGKNFIVVFDSTILYTGSFVSPVLSSIRNTPVIYVEGNETELEEDEIQIKLGYPTKVYYIGEDVRINQKFFSTLDNGNKVYLQTYHQGLEFYLTKEHLHYNFDISYDTLSIDNIVLQDTPFIKYEEILGYDTLYRNIYTNTHILKINKSINKDIYFSTGYPDWMFIVKLNNNPKCCGFLYSSSMSRPLEWLYIVEPYDIDNEKGLLEIIFRSNEGSVNPLHIPEILNRLEKDNKIADFDNALESDL